MLEGGERIGCLDTSDNALGVTVSEAFRKTLTREMEALEDHLGDGRTLQMGRVRLDRVNMRVVIRAVNRGWNGDVKKKQVKPVASWKTCAGLPKCGR